jgi:hypothetical protein
MHTGRYLLVSASQDLTARVWAVSSSVNMVDRDAHGHPSTGSDSDNGNASSDGCCLSVIDGFSEYYMESTSDTTLPTSTTDVTSASEIERVFQSLESPPYLDGHVSLCLETAEFGVFVVGNALHIWSKNAKQKQ